MAGKSRAQTCTAPTLSILDPLSGNVRSKYSQPEIQYATMLSRGPHSLAPATPWYRGSLDYGSINDNRITRAYEIYLNKESHAVPETDNRPVLRNGDEGGKEKLETRLNLTCIRNS